MHVAKATPIDGSYPGLQETPNSDDKDESTAQTQQKKKAYMKPGCLHTGSKAVTHPIDDPLGTKIRIQDSE